MRLHQVLPNLYVSRMPMACDIPLLNERGLQHLVCVSKKPPATEVTQGRTFRHEPLHDEEVIPTVTPLVAYTVEAIKTEPLLLHCYLGRNRSWFIAALIWAEVTGNSGPNALHYVRSLRPGAIPSPVLESYISDQK